MGRNAGGIRTNIEFFGLIVPRPLGQCPVPPPSARLILLISSALIVALLLWIHVPMITDTQMVRPHEACLQTRQSRLASRTGGRRGSTTCWLDAASLPPRVILKVADGVMGLGYSDYSFALQAADKLGGKFSYCLVYHLSPKNVSSYLIFGSHEQANISFNSKMQYTELVLGVIYRLYAVNIRGISIGGSMREIPAETWIVSGVGGVVVDTGNSLTGLAQPAHQPIMAALKPSLVGFKKLDGPVEYCFNSTRFDESLVPRLVFHFGDGARFEPPVNSYVIDSAPVVNCLGFVPAAWPGVSIIGNIMQQNYFWEFDLVNGRLRFAASSCTKTWNNNSLS